MQRRQSLLVMVMMLLMVFKLAWAATVAATDIIYTEDKHHITVTSDHPTFTIQLKSNPTTGYSWFLREYNKNIVLPLKHSFQKPDSKLMGAPGYEIWTFQIKPAGFTVPQQTVIRFVYARPWEHGDNTTQVVFNVTTSGK